MQPLAASRVLFDAVPAHAFAPVVGCCLQALIMCRCAVSQAPSAMPCTTSSRLIWGIGNSQHIAGLNDQAHGAVGACKHRRPFYTISYVLHQSPRARVCSIPDFAALISAPRPPRPATPTSNCLFQTRASGRRLAGAHACLCGHSVLPCQPAGAQVKRSATVAAAADASFARMRCVCISSTTLLGSGLNTQVAALLYMNAAWPISYMMAPLDAT